MIFFFCTADKTNSKISNNLNRDRNNSISMECLLKTFKTTTHILNIIMVKKIENIIIYLKPTYSHGYDEIFVKILKATSHLISSPLSYICNKSFSS